MNAAIRRKPTVPADIVADARVIGEDEVRLIRFLYRNRDQAIRLTSLLYVLGIPYEVTRAGIMPHTSFVRFFCLLTRVKGVLARHGWTVGCTGSTYRDDIWISEQSGSPG